MKLITKAVEHDLRNAPLYSTDGQNIAPVLVKFFTPDSSWTWYVLEARQVTAENETDGDGPIGDWTFFGLVEGHEKELGYFTLSELQKIRGSLRLPVERDINFSAHQVNKLTMQVSKRVGIEVTI